jgi:hypothetical protein
LWDVKKTQGDRYPSRLHRSERSRDWLRPGLQPGWPDTSASTWSRTSSTASRRAVPPRAM